MLRITGGILKGRYVLTSKKKGVRYTSSKVRKAIFDMVEVEGLQVLDLFAGSGIFAFEALSRGAKSATCVEKDREMAEIIKENCKRLSLQKDLMILREDVRKAIPKLYKLSRRYDIIFLDPPYKEGYVEKVLQVLERYPLFDEGTIFIFEHSSKILYSFSGFESFSRKRYGGTLIEIMKRRN